MSEEKMMRLGQVARKLNVGIATIVESMAKKGFEVENNPNSKISMDQYSVLAKEFKSSAQEKEEASHLSIGKRHHETFTIEADSDAREESKPVPVKEEKKVEAKEPAPAPKPEPTPAAPEKEKVEEPKVTPEAPKLPGIKVLGKIDLSPKAEPTPAPKKVEKAIEKPKEEVKPQPKKEEAPRKEFKKEEKSTQAVKPQQNDNAKTQKPAPITSNKPTPKEQAPKQQEPKPVVVPAKPEVVPQQVIAAKADSLKGLTVLGKIELPTDKPKKKGKPVASSDERNKDKKKRVRKRIDKNTPGGDAAKGGAAAGGARPATPGQPQGGHRAGGGPNSRERRSPQGRPGQGGGRPAQGGHAGGRVQKAEPTQKEIQDQIKQTLARLQGGKAGGGKGKNRRDKKAERSRDTEDGIEESKVLKVTEFISANDLASLMDVSVNQVISTCMSLGMFVSINQRLDAEAITIIADEFDYEVEFTKSDEEENFVEEIDNPEDLVTRAPIVTIMGHVDHGKTSLLDYIRRAKVTDDEAGGITQHIGAYDVMTNTGEKIAFLDTPGHEAFTAMRARGAKITDVAIIVVAADDDIMPQTKEAINHAQVAGVPMIFAINKIDKPNANPNKIKEQLANMNLLVEEWGGKYQSQDISAKVGTGIEELLEKVLLEAEVLELTANPNKNAVGTVVEASLDKGRGYVTTVMVQAGTLRVGDVMLAGQHYGKVKAMFDHKGKKLKEAAPSTPVQVLGLGGAPQAGDTFKVYDSEREAREIANSREQIQREQSMRTKKHITLDEIGRRLAIGSFKELNIIIKGDVDGSVEALSDSLLKLSKDEVSVNIIHKGVGQISESDVLLASASDAIIIGFQVRPSPNAKKIAEQEEIEIRHYSIIYDAINQIKDAIEGMLEPEFEEIITGNIQVREIFKISKIGTVAGSYVTDGFITRKNKIRVIRDGIVVHDGEIDQLKRFKDDVSEVKAGYECGISIKKFNDILVDDTIEGYTMQEIKRKK
ncbi:translation initiation factor IF-2 [Belliella aquatica]|uniref:Translation initiation factor IF-2 n=1 Tax=Belliella aquatica TaxID=1323734 RepID=A0ABQ1MJD8_9BACT|nr:translation initiation factor IF-2 [Belliella aquatica]MCH7405435.1 translation initiation factor IF-2 [Belliella aquatica]GGC41612.1 translation initiation factor IF-2 [Belliella aquatica]